MEGINTDMADEFMAGLLKSMELMALREPNGSADGDEADMLALLAAPGVSGDAAWSGADGEFLLSGAAGGNLSDSGGLNVSALLRSIFDGQGRKRSVMRSVVIYVDIYVVPLVALVGLLGNMLSFTVFGCTFMRRLSSSIYLAALALADLGFLLCVLVSWTINTGLDLYAQEGWCQTFLYLTYVSHFLSVWYVVSFTTERYIAVHFPLRRQDLCTIRRAKLVVVLLAAFALLFYTFATWTSGISVIFLTPVCGPLPNFNRVVQILNNIDTVITLILPFVAILVMNVRIAYKVARFYRERKSMQLQTWSYSRWSTRRFHCVGRATDKAALYTRTQVRVTKMLLTVSTIFLLLNLPRHTVRTYLFIMNLLNENYQPTETYLLWHKFFEFLYYLQFSINLFLYNAFGKNFRKALVLLWKRVKHNVVESVSKSYMWRTRRSFFHAGEGEITLQEYRHISGDSGKYV